MKERTINFRLIFYPFIAFMFGIIVAKGLFSGKIDVIVTSVFVFAIVGGFFIFKKSIKPFIVILAFFLIGNGFYFLGESTFNVKNYQGKVAVVGRITDDIQTYSYEKQVILDNVTINGEKSNNLRLIISNCAKELKVGDKVAFETEVVKSKPFTLKQFNSKDYRLGVRYNAEVDFDNIVFSSGFQKVDEIIRQDVKNLIYQNMSEENAGIAYAVMFGDKSDLDGEIYTSYQESGIIHVLTVSGLHVGFLVSLFYGFLKKCRVNKIVNLIISTLVIVLYAYLCGFSPSVVRAGIMANCMMFAKVIQRKYDSLNALGLAGFVLCVIKPLTALDIGFLMSFFCVFAILMLNPAITKFLSKILPKGIASLIALSTSAQLGILPFVAAMGGSINLISFAVNLIIVPAFAVLYPFLFLVSMFGTFMPFIGVLLKAVDFIFMIINKIAIFFGHAGLTIPLSPMGFALTVIFFFILFFIGRYFMLNSLKKFSLFTGSFILLVFALCLYALPINSNLTSISYLNSYGQGSVIITSKSGQTAVVGENGLLGRYQSEYHNDHFDTYFSFRQLADEEVSDFAPLGFKNFITCANVVDEGGGNCDVVETNKNFVIGDIQFSYLTAYDNNSDSQKLLGIIIKVDNHSIFVAYENNLSYNLFENAFEEYSPEIVVAGDMDNLALNNDYICITQNQVKGSDINYQNKGNLQVSFNGKNWIERGLD